MGQQGLSEPEVPEGSAPWSLTRSMAVDVEYWPTPDPSVATGTREQILNAYRDAFDRLEARIAARFAAA